MADLYLESLKSSCRVSIKIDKQNNSAELLRKYLGRIQGRVGIAFSGGVDSTYLTRMAKDACVGPVVPFLLVSPFLAGREHVRACRVVDKIGLLLRKVTWNPFEFHSITKNGLDRCYHCKYAMYKRLWTECREYGISNLLDGTQLDDMGSDRPGLRAIQRLRVKTPLADCKLNKDMIRNLSAEMSLPTWDMPSQSCLATKVSVGTVLTVDLLKRIESAEDFPMDLEMC